MRVDEIVGFVITLMAIFFLILQPIWIALMRKKRVVEEEEELEEEHVSPKKMGRQRGHQPKQQSITQRQREREYVAPQVQKPVQVKVSPDIRTPSIPNVVKAKHWHETKGREEGSRGRDLLDRLPNKQEMLILHEIIGPPKVFKG